MEAGSTRQSTGTIKACAYASGIITLSVAVAAVFLPKVEVLPKAGYIGALLSVAGLAEALLGLSAWRSEWGKASIASGFVTALAGLVFVAVPGAGFFPVAPAMVGWLLLTGTCMLVGALARQGKWRRIWMAATGVADVLLGILLIKGLRITAFIFLLFGPTPEMIATLAFILAASLTIRASAQIAIGATLRPGEAQAFH